MFSVYLLLSKNEVSHFVIFCVLQFRFQKSVLNLLDSNFKDLPTKHIVSDLEILYRHLIAVNKQDAFKSEVKNDCLEFFQKIKH